MRPASYSSTAEQRSCMQRANGRTGTTLLPLVRLAPVQASWHPMRSRHFGVHPCWRATSDSDGRFCSTVLCRVKWSSCPYLNRVRGRARGKIPAKSYIRAAPRQADGCFPWQHPPARPAPSGASGTVPRLRGDARLGGSPFAARRRPVPAWGGLLLRPLRRDADPPKTEVNFAGGQAKAAGLQADAT